MVYCTLKYKSNILIKKNSGNLFVTISASARGICTRKCEQILCLGTFILFISTNGCLYNFFLHIFYKKCWLQFICNKLISPTAHESVKIISTKWFMHISHLISVNIFLENFNMIETTWSVFSLCRVSWNLDSYTYVSEILFSANREYLLYNIRIYVNFNVWEFTAP